MIRSIDIPFGKNVPTYAAERRKNEANDYIEGVESTEFALDDNYEYMEGQRSNPIGEDDYEKE